MKRNMTLALQTWKNSKNRKPFYLTGIKGVGKTYLSCDFARSFFDSYLYISFEHNKELILLLEQQSEAQIFSTLAKYFEFPEEYIDTIPLIFDEIHLCKGLVAKLLHFIKQKNKNELYWIFISSYDMLTENERVEVDYHTLYPLQYDEFLLALGKEWYIEVITAHYKNQKKLPDMVHRDLLSIFDEYLWIGGMPNVVMEYLTMESSINVMERQCIQKQLLLHGIDQIAEEKTSYKCHQIYATIDEQLRKKNQKFQFTLIRKGTTYQMYKDAIEFLVKHYMVYQIPNLDLARKNIEITKENGNKDTQNTKTWQQFKLFYSDFSLNHAARNDELSVEEHYIRLQNYLYQTFAEKKIPCYFWESKSQASLDFVIKTKDMYLPIELRQEKRSKTKSILSFQNQYHFSKNVVRISSENFVKSDEFFNIPLYSLFCFEN